ncbi:MAG TPA: hypothetical protein VKU19_14715 [Bryobacteraceae bacterium]|nr:hypothetical protein [Bryobacteraceae bacterium]
MIRILCLMALACGALAFQDSASAQDREKDVYRIYSLLMTNPQTSHGPDNNPRFLIAVTTRSPLPGEPCVRPREREAEFQEVLADFQARKATARTLQRQLMISKPYVLLSEDQVNAFRNKQNVPEFQGVTDVFTLGDVYFSKNGRLALTGISSWCGGLCALELWKVLTKLPSGEWQELPWVTCTSIAGLLPSVDARS